MSRLVHHTVRVPATSANLGPGFDAFGLALDRHLVVASRPGPADGPLAVVSGEGAGELPDDDTNLVVRSLVAFCEHHGVPVPAVGLRVHNDIPLERGLGSSSAAIVAGLVLARSLTGIAVADRVLVELATQIEGHPDNVAPAVLGGFVVAAVDDAGELDLRRVNPAPRWALAAFVPDRRQATAAARAVLPGQLPADQVVAQAARAGHVVGAITGVWEPAAGLVADHLHEPARRTVMEPSAELLDALRASGRQAWLSGAGPSVMALRERHDAHGDALDDMARRHGFTPMMHTIDLAGAIACPDGGCAFAGGGTCVQCPRGEV